MGKWLRVDALFRKHPKFIAAGRRGTEVTQAAWEIAKAFDCPGGDITQYWTPAYVAKWLNADSGEIDSVAEGMASAETAELIQRQDGRVVIHDWLDHQPRTSTDRVREHRARKKHKKRNETVSPVTGNVSLLHGNAETTHGTNGTNIQNTQHALNYNINKNEHESASSVRVVDGPVSDTPTAASEARQMEAIRTSVPCLQCGERWMLIRGRNGNFYGHGRTGSGTGCRATCSVEDYQAELDNKNSQKLCSICGEYMVYEGKDFCAPCMARGGNHGR
jgi:hypothetical protein